MLEQKIRLKKAIESKEPKSRVYEFFQEYEEAYQKKKNPSQALSKEYCDMYFLYLDYMQKRDK